MWPFNHDLPTVAGRSPTWRDVSCSLTAFGRGWLCVAVILLVVMWVYGLNLAAWIGLMLLGVLCWDTWSNMRQLIGLQIDVKLDDEVFAGEPVSLRLIAQGRQMPRQLWLGTDEMPSEKSHEISKLWQLWSIVGEGDDECFWQILAGKRGRLVVPPLHTVAFSPFGLTTASCVWHWPSDAPVYPQPIQEAESVQRYGQARHNESAQTMPSDDVSHLSEHRVGAPKSRVAWKHYAKSGSLADKQFDAGVVGHTTERIAFDDYPNHWPKEQIASRLCARVLAAEAAKQDYILVLPNNCIGNDVGRRVKALTALAYW